MVVILGDFIDLDDDGALISKKVVLHVYHGGGFQRMPYLVYCDGNISEFESDCKKLSVEDIRDNILALGYSDRMIKGIYFSKSNLAFEESLVAINSETVDELRLLSPILQYLYLYIEHNVDMASDYHDSHSTVDDNYDEYGLDFDDDEVVKIIKTKQKMEKDHLPDFEALKDEGV
ncbi:hypothetical protein Cgig2_002041 [Carnegiea gigantea]|uniref:Uncharacterized protein n=1 Tax=Carnegiea gigantea TaxID=171969 RepID=A0A9Q1K582_9CARY|nr:hypothetical protein Cgig2_002041 [Carnegiea gigantea]